MSELSLIAQGYNGWKGSVFYAKFNNGAEPHLIRIGTELSLHHFSMPWSPLNQQVFAQSVYTRMDGQNRNQMVIERGPMVAMVDFVMERDSPYPPQGFDEFLNVHILKDTPYEVKLHRDLSILSDATPVYGDPDSLHFKSAEAEKENHDNHADPSWYQHIMRIIDRNSKMVGWPKELAWVVEAEPDIFKTKQEMLYPDPTGLKPEPRRWVETHTPKDGG